MFLQPPEGFVEFPLARLARLNQLPQNTAQVGLPDHDNSENNPDWLDPALRPRKRPLDVSEDIDAPNSVELISVSDSEASPPNNTGFDERVKPEAVLDRERNDLEGNRTSTADPDRAPKMGRRQVALQKLTSPNFETLERRLDAIPEIVDTPFDVSRAGIVTRSPQHPLHHSKFKMRHHLRDRYISMSLGGFPITVTLETPKIGALGLIRFISGDVPKPRYRDLGYDNGSAYDKVLFDLKAWYTQKFQTKVWEINGERSMFPWC